MGLLIGAMEAFLQTHILIEHKSLLFWLMHQDDVLTTCDILLSQTSCYFLYQALIFAIDEKYSQLYFVGPKETLKK